MRNRYKVSSPWSDDQTIGQYIVQSADATDQANGTIYRECAFRVILTSGKPAKTGKGGTVPFYGESAWSDAQRLASDLALADLYAR